MASFNYRLNPLYLIKECSSCGALYTTDNCCFEGSLGDRIICDLNKAPDLSQRSLQNCPKSRNPVDGHYCQGCALLRNKFKEDLFTYCIENGILQDSFKPSNDNTNVVNALQEPFVVNQDPNKNSSQSPPQINHHCCYGCGESLEDIFCHQCTYELYGKGAHYGYNCPPKVLIDSNLKPFKNQTIDELPQTDRPTICYDDDGEDCTIAITPILSTQEPNNSLSMRDEHLDTVPATESDEFIKSSVENLVLILRILQFNNDSTSIDDESFPIDNIKYVEASPPDSELVILEVMEIVIPKVGGIDDDILLTIKDDILHEKGDFYEFTDELAHIISPPEYDCFCFKNEPTGGDFTMDVVEDIFPTRKPRVHNALPTYPTFQLNLDFILSGNEDTIFDPSICSYHISSFIPDVYHRSGTFIKFNVLNGSPMEILFSTCSPMDK
nr:hypothetical protein [Tanacetum cinerariifolium]